MQTVTQTSIDLAYDGSSGIDSLADLNDLWINVKLDDALAKTTNSYRSTLIVTVDEPAVLIPLINPYLEPVPEPAYIFSQTDDI